MSMSTMPEEKMASDNRTLESRELTRATKGHWRPKGSKPNEGAERQRQTGRERERESEAEIR